MSDSGRWSDRLPPYAGVVVAIVAALAGFAAVYVTLGPADNASAPAAKQVSAPASEGKGAETAKLNNGLMAAFVYKKSCEPVPPLSFTDGDGRERSLVEWKGRVVLLNLWATWCAPCRKEMPELDRLQAELGSEAFEVMALAVDRAGAGAARKFLDQIKAQSLALYVDATARGATELKAVGLPTTLLLSRQGCEIGRLTGPAEWHSEDAKRLIRAALETK